MKSPRWLRMEGRDAFTANVPFEDCPYERTKPYNRKLWQDGWSQAQHNYISEKEAKIECNCGHPDCNECFTRVIKTRFLVFAGEQFYANGGANDLVSTSCRTEKEAVKYANDLLENGIFISHVWHDEYTTRDDGSKIEWVQVFDLEKCEVIHRIGKVYGEDSGILILPDGGG